MFEGELQAHVDQHEIGALNANAIRPGARPLLQRMPSRLHPSRGMYTGFQLKTRALIMLLHNFWILSGLTVCCDL